MSPKLLKNLYPFLDQRYILALNQIMMRSQSTYIVNSPFYEICTSFTTQPGPPFQKVHPPSSWERLSLALLTFKQPVGFLGHC